MNNNQLYPFKNMHNFNIEILSKKPEKRKKKLVYKGQITIGDLKETFIMLLDNWSLNEYKQQWRDGLERIKTYDSSCLVVSFNGPRKDPWIELWVLYRENNTIFIQNHLLIDEIFQEKSKELPPFDKETCYLYISPRETVSQNGMKISEWTIDINDIPEI